MKKFDIKSIALGLGIGIIGASIVFVAVGKKTTAITDNGTIAISATEVKESAGTSDGKHDVAAGEGITSAVISNDKIYFNGKEIELKKPLLTVMKEGNSEPQLYMPMDELLEYMHFKVDWNSKDNAVYLTMNGQNDQESAKIVPDDSNNDIDAKAIEIINKTGNWSYIEGYLPNMTNDGINKVVDIYNSKHVNPSEHKKASDYIKN